MRILFHKNFKKHYKKLPGKIQKKFNERLAIFLEEHEHPLLNVHALKGEDKPFWSMNVTSDYRALFTQEKNTVIFHRIGTHSDFY